MSNNLWHKEILEAYEELKLLHVLRFEIKNISESDKGKAKKNVEPKSWEKTIEDIFRIDFNEDLEFSASLDGSEENYGDLIAAFKNLTWCIIEFKKEKSDLPAEEKKYVAINKNKYLDKTTKKLRKGKELFEINIENKAFSWLSQKFGPNSKIENLEPHFLVYGEYISDPQNLIIHAIGYWGKWSGSTNKDVVIPYVDIPKHAGSYENFANYAAFLRVAKSGEFMLSEKDFNDGTGGALKDLSVVIGIHKNKEIQCITTLERFLEIFDYSQKQTPPNSPRPNPKLS